MIARAFFWVLSICMDWSLVRLLWRTGAANFKIVSTGVWYTVRSCWVEADAPRSLNLMRTHRVFVARLVMLLTWVVQKRSLAFQGSGNREVKLREEVVLLCRESIALKTNMRAFEKSNNSLTPYSSETCHYCQAQLQLQLQLS